MFGEPVIQTHELTKTYSHPLFWWSVRARALSELTVSVERGEVFGLLGPNGSGKTTTIKLLLGLIFPTSGQVSVFGQRPENLEIKKLIGYLPEESYLYRFLNAEETLDFYGRLFGLSKKERKYRVDSLLELTGLQQERHRPIIEYSKGMQRRIGLAQTLINDPQLVILDEPTTGLDPIGTHEMKNLIRELQSKGKTVLLSSHLLSDVEDVCDRVLILYGGQLRAVGPVEELLCDQHLTQITAEMDDETIDAVEELLYERLGDEADIEISPPIMRLEKFFMQTIERAQREKATTSGAQASSGHLDFMDRNTSNTENIIEQLAKNEAEQDSADNQSGVEELRPKSNKSSALISGLVESAQDEVAPEDTPSQPVTKKEEEDHGLIDKLTKPEDE